MITPISDRTLFPIMAEFNALTQQMDDAYNQAATANGFVCKGCRQSCCETRFYHHTYIEYYLLQSGMMSLPKSQQCEIVALAAEVRRNADRIKSPYRIMCPLNSKGLCRLYNFRPMVCRMHGIAHVFKRPDGVRISGTGCHRYEKKCSTASPILLDRTPFYQQMAALEGKLRSIAGLKAKIKMTIAEMILAPNEN